MAFGRKRATRIVTAIARLLRTRRALSVLDINRWISMSTLDDVRWEKVERIKLVLSRWNVSRTPGAGC